MHRAPLPLLLLLTGLELLGLALLVIPEPAQWPSLAIRAAGVIVLVALGVLLLACWRSQPQGEDKNPPPTPAADKAEAPPQDPPSGEFPRIWAG